MAQGKFIVIEGQGFTGKTTQAHLLAQKLEQKGIEVEVFRHPGGTEKAEHIRKILLEKKAQGVLTPDDEVELLFKALKSLMEDAIVPALESGKWVILTRFTPSSFVYQGIVEGVDMTHLKHIASSVTGKYNPDLYILLDLEESEILKRLNEAKDTELHSYNEKDPEIIEKRREGFLTLAAEENWVVVDTSASKEQVSSEIWEEVAQKFELPS